ncbi:MAG: MerC domain-containing protein [Fimbriimonadaceae bacterium]|nr:MerC domain-containing protein [Fimbriimonadaceae bacterium]
MKRLTWDHVGAMASSLCAVHCLLTGFAVGLLSVAGLGFVATPAAEMGFVAVACLVGLAALIHGHQRHHSLVPAMIFAIGMLVLVLGQVVEANHWGPEWLHHGGNIIAGLTLIAFHVVNQRMQHACGSVHCDHRH